MSLHHNQVCSGINNMEVNFDERQRVAAMLGGVHLEDDGLYSVAEKFFMHSRYKEAIELYHSLLSKELICNFNVSRAHVNYGEALQADGQLPSGWVEREHRLFANNPLVNPWDGRKISGKRLLIHFEGGLGDAFFFARWIKQIKTLGVSVIMQVKRPLKMLFSLQPYIDMVIASTETLPPFDYDVYLMSLPGFVSSQGFVATALESIPQNGPFVIAPQEIVEQWQQKIAADAHKLKVGICWRASSLPGGVVRKYDRDIPLDKLIRTLATQNNISIYSMQGPEHRPIRQSEYLVRKKAGTLEKLNEKDIVPDDAPAINLVDEKNGPFVNLVALAPLLDCVISVDTVVANLAAASGAQTHILLPRESDWRWLTKKHIQNHSPFFPKNVVLHWQKQQGNWDSALLSLSQELTKIP